MKRVLTVAALVAFTTSLSFGGFKWGSGINVITDFNGDPVATSDSFDPTVGAFAQLIRILSGSEPYDFVNSGSGIDTLNEVVVDTMYSGLYEDLSDPGTFSFGPFILNDSAFDGTYYVRVFDAPQANVGDWNLGGDAPIPASAQYYFQSATYNYVHNDLAPVTWNFGSGQTTLAIVPEPGVLAMMGLGLFGLAAARRRLQA